MARNHPFLAPVFNMLLKSMFSMRKGVGGSETRRAKIKDYAFDVLRDRQHLRESEFLSG